MKKLAMVMMVASLSAMLLTGCGNKAENTESTAAEESSQAAETAETEAEQKVYAEDSYVENLNVADYVELGEYIGLEASMVTPYVPEEQIDSYIDNVLAQNKERTEIKDRAVKEGDVTDISYVGKKDGVAFDGGTADNYELVIGSHTFIDGFEDGVIGMKAGEVKDLNLTFPENYQNADLAGAEVVFTVTLNKIYEEKLPVLNDAFVAGLEIEDVATVDAYRQYVYDNLLKQVQAQHDSEVENIILQKAYENTKVENIPEAMTERYYDRLLNNITYQASMYGMDLATFMSAIGAGEDYETEMKESAEEAAGQILMMQAIAEKEGLTVSDEEMDKDIESKAAQYGYESADAYKEAIGGEIKGYREMLISEKVMAFLVEKAVVTDTPAEEVEAAATQTQETEGTEAETESAAETKGAETEAEGTEAETESTEAETESAKAE